MCTTNVDFPLTNIACALHCGFNAIPTRPAMYMQVENRTGTFLHLKRNPSIRSWSLLVVFYSISKESPRSAWPQPITVQVGTEEKDIPSWALVHVYGSFTKSYNPKSGVFPFHTRFLGVEVVLRGRMPFCSPSESGRLGAAFNRRFREAGNKRIVDPVTRGEAIFDKKVGKVVLKTFNLYKKILTFCKGGQEEVVVLLKEIRDVNVEEEKVRYFGKGYLIVLRLVTGISHPLTQSAVLGGRSDVEAVAKLLTTFLDLDLAGFRSRIEEESSDSEETLDKEDE
ncbi:unnamed protein product [Ranitomeya imitator]|uniref:Essential for reactive oxygen species protein n=1 Tax=Ranitomeya imitator TaxID=111125 RepID=A0ABN9LD89_9NEOB|nr:unnamed protein product [Ranitomeya imitator]